MTRSEPSETFGILLKGLVLVYRAHGRHFVSVQNENTVNGSIFFYMYMYLFVSSKESRCGCDP